MSIELVDAGTEVFAEGTSTDLSVVEIDFHSDLRWPTVVTAHPEAAICRSGRRTPGSSSLDGNDGASLQLGCSSAWAAPRVPATNTSGWAFELQSGSDTPSVSGCNRARG